MAENNYFQELVSKYINSDVDPDFQLSYYPINAELARKFKECKISASARCAYDYIVLNAANIRNGISRPIDVDALCEYLGLSRRRTYQLLSELEAHDFLVPRSSRSRWCYDIPALSVHTDNMKENLAKKHAKYLEKKIQLIADVINQESDFSTRQRNSFLKVFRDYDNFDVQLRCITSILGGPLTTEQQERLKSEFEKLDKRTQ